MWRKRDYRKCEAQFCDGKTRIIELEQENAALKQVCRNVYEVWAGSEGIPEPETCPEAYLLQLVEQMRDEAKEGLE